MLSLLKKRLIFFITCSLKNHQQGGFMYTKPETALRELRLRWEDARLRSKVREFLNGAQLPSSFEREPQAVYARQVATPNFEAQQFLERAKTLELPAFWWEYSGDKFYPGLPEKWHWGRMVFFEGHGKKSGQKTARVTVIDFNKYSGKPMKEIQTLWEKPFVEFHNGLFPSGTPPFELYESTDWMSRAGASAECYYKYFLAAFICQGILLENFLPVKHEQEFWRDIIQPAIQELISFFGIEPLIVRLIPQETECDEYWMWYPPEIKHSLPPEAVSKPRHLR